MLISRYSAPDFDPYGDNLNEEPDELWRAPSARSAVTAVVALPGSKSLTNRELVLAALANSPSRLSKPLASRDSALMIEALRSLGTRIEAVSGPSGTTDLVITPADELIGSTTIDCGLAGTVMRFLPPLAGLALGPTTFDGDAGARRRPMATTISSLRDLGVDIDDLGTAALPFTVHGTGTIRGGAITIDASTSSQFVSGLLLAAARFEDGMDLTHSGERLPSQPHIEMTIATLAARGIIVEQPATGRWIVKPGAIAGIDVEIEPDLSNAAPFLAAAIATGGSITIPGWPASTTQVGDDLLELLPRFGASVTRSGDHVTVTGGDRITGVDLDLSTGGELVPNLVALAALADGPSEFRGIGHIRHHETDRLAALAAEINNLGGRVTESEDGLRVEPAPLHGGVWRSHSDHRMATTGAIIGLVVDGVDIHDIGTTAKTMPDFPALWHAMLSEGGTSNLDLSGAPEGITG